MERKNRVSIVLMLVSMILLVVLQFFWILISYEKASDGLTRDANLLFRTSIVSIQNATWMKTIAGLSADSLSGIRVVFSDSLGGPVRRERRALQRNVELTIESGNDSDKIQLRSKISRTPVGIDTAKNSNFVVRFHNDSIDQDTLALLFSDALKQAKIDVGFVIKHQLIEENVGVRQRRNPMNDIIIDQRNQVVLNGGATRRSSLYADSIQTEPFRVSPLHSYSASLFNVRGILLRQVTPQILFSAFLTLMISAAFLMMYRNLRAQERLMKAKNDFIGNISHELKTPVATVSVVLEALKNFHAMDNPKLTSEYLDIAQAELNRLSLMTDKILKTAVFEDKGVEYEPEPVDLDKIIAQVLGSMKLVFEKQNAKVVFEKKGDNFMFSGSVIHLTNMIYNLLDNALKYGSTHPEIKISLTDYSHQLVLIIKDNGIGIDPVYHKKVFDKFFRIPHGDIHNIKGYGLGLNYVSSVVKRHRGTIDLKSEPNRGSEFSITFPR